MPDAKPAISTEDEREGSHQPSSCRRVGAVKSPCACRKLPRPRSSFQDFKPERTTTMAFSQRSIIILALFAIIFIACAAASERQPLFADSTHLSAGARALPQRFQEMVQRRRLAQAGSYGLRPAAYGTPGVYGVYGR